MAFRGEPGASRNGRLIINPHDPIQSFCQMVIRVFVRCSVRSIMHKHLEKMGEVTFDNVFNQKLGE